MKGQSAYITPELLKWARQSAKLTVYQLSTKLKVKEKKVQDWENGTDFPTINQLEKVAKYCRRPLSVFYLPEPPEDFQTLRDFRKKDQQREYSTALTFIIRDIQRKQNWLSDILAEEDESKLDFVGRFTSDSAIADVAANIKEELEIDIAKNTDKAFKEWITKVENKGIFVSLASNVHSHLLIDKDEVKGFAISDNLAPFIFINTADSKNSQLFTLVHELVHIWINATGLSAFDAIDFRNESEKFDQLELFCNEVTAEILMPKDEILSEFRKFDRTQAYIEEKSKTFNVSSYAMIVRLLNLDLISLEEYRAFKKSFFELYEDYLEKQKNKPKPKGGPNYYVLQIRKNSRLFSHYVYSYYKSGKINGYDASNLLEIKVSRFRKLEQFLYS